ncbi:MAG: NAD-dependent succinate-semialdehyde dehydrogenase, partial [Thermoanaerobaculia bacterium]
MLKAINPATGETLREVPEHDEQEVNERLEAAEAAFKSWRRFDFEERARHLTSVADLLRENMADFARLMTEEMGKTLASAESEVDKCAWVCDFYAENAERFLANETVATDATKSFIRYEPLGPVLAIMPWNFPFWQFFRFAAPALMAGNVALLKHAANVPGSALAIEAVFREAGLPAGVVTTLLVSSARVKLLINSPVVRAVTLTGSDRAGMEVAAEAGRCLKKAVLELGGSDPFIVLSDVDPAEAGRQAAKARTINNGQSCIAAKRFIVHRDIAEQFIDGFVAGMQALVVGDPIDPDTQLGPLASVRLAGELEEQVAASVRLGAIARCGGKRDDAQSAYFPATVLTDIPADSPAYSEELFGPVGCVFVARDATEAIRIANDTRFGLAASAWTRDAEEQQRFARELDAGSVFV